MVWGIHEAEKQHDNSNNYKPDELIAQLNEKSKIQNEFVRWLPIAWDKSDISSPSNNIKKWIWVLMLEIYSG